MATTAQTTDAPKPDVQAPEQTKLATTDNRPAEIQKFEFQQRAAKLFAMSGLFADIKGQTPEQSIAQAFVKISMGDSMGFNPAESMTGIDIIQGRVAVGSSLRAARMQRAGYTWDILQLDDKGCRLRLNYKGQPLMQEEIDSSTGKVSKVPAIVAFTVDDATRAGLLGKDNYKKNPRNMFFARAITNAQRWYAPGILGVDILDTEEAAALSPVIDLASENVRVKTVEREDELIAKYTPRPTGDESEAPANPPQALESQAEPPAQTPQEAASVSTRRGRHQPSATETAHGVAGIFAERDK